MLQRNTSGSAPLLAGLAILAGLLGLIVVSPRFLLYDERYYMESAFFLRAHSDLVAMMRTPLDLAAGPLYAILHAALSPLTNLSLPAVRLVNPACLLLTIWAAAALLRRLGYDHPAGRAVMLLAVPMIGPTTGMALTELPGLACAALATLAVARGAEERSERSSWLLWLAGGALAGLAVFARQTYLPALVALPLLGHVRGQIVRAMAALVVALIPVAFLLAVWGGLVFPGQASAAHGIVPLHAVQAFIYLAVAVALIAPRFFIDGLLTPRPAIAAAIVALAAAGLLLAFDIRMPVADRVVAKLPAGLQGVAVPLLAAAMAALGAIVAVAASIRLWERRDDPRFLLLAGLTVALTGTAAGIGHQFSSRYVLTAFPFALLALQPWIVAGWWAAARVIFGALLGFASLSAYYWNAPPTDPTFFLSAPRAIVAEMPLSAEDRGYALVNDPPGAGS